MAAKARVGMVGVLWQRILRCREKISSSKNAERLLIGLTFFGFVFSIATWHWWLEQKVGLYAWVLCVLATVVLSLVAPDRNVAFAIFVFGGSYVSVARIWQAFHGEVPGYVPALWTLGTALVGSLAPKWKMTLIAALGMWAVLSLKAVLLDREPRAIYITAIACALIIGLLLTARHSDT
jgi:hypothetical protein